MTERALWPRMTAALLALLGLIDSAYLTIHHYRPSVTLSCPVGGGCETVQSSIWSTLPPGNGGIPVALIGVGGYAVLVMLALVALQRDRVGSIVVPTVLLLVAGGGLFFSIYLTVVQLFVIGTVCFWCAMSALFEVGIFVAAFVNWRAWRREEAAQAQDPSVTPSLGQGVAQGR